MDRRAVLKGMVATAAGILVPGGYEQRVWALDRTMLSGRDRSPTMPPGRWVAIEVEPVGNLPSGWIVRIVEGEPHDIVMVDGIIIPPSVEPIFTVSQV